MKPPYRDKVDNGCWMNIHLGDCKLIVSCCLLNQGLLNSICLRDFVFCQSKDAVLCLNFPGAPWNILKHIQCICKVTTVLKPHIWDHTMEAFKVVRRDEMVNSNPRISGWWFGCHFFIFPLILGFDYVPNWRTHIFRGVAQPPTRYTSECIPFNHDKDPMEYLWNIITIHNLRISQGYRKTLFRFFQ